MEIKLYEIEYGNGWNGCRSNSGKKLVLAEDMKSAKKILSEHYNVKNWAYRESTTGSFPSI
jgi:hypothetical protein